MQFFTLTKKGIAVITLCAAAFFTALILVTNTADSSAAAKKLPIYSVERPEKMIALTFDAAWGAEDTNEIIDTLEQYHVNATFFVVGGWVDQYPAQVKALADAGNEIGNHSNTHPHMAGLSGEQLDREISECSAKIEKATGVWPKLFRAPYGEYTDSLLTMLSGKGMYCVQWSDDSWDWKGRTVGQIEERVLSKATPGGIVLFHNAAKNTPQALPAVIEGLQRQGYKLVTVGQLIYKDHYTIDHTGRQFPVTATTPPPRTTVTIFDSCTVYK